MKSRVEFIVEWEPQDPIEDYVDEEDAIKTQKDVLDIIESIVISNLQWDNLPIKVLSSTIKEV